MAKSYQLLSTLSMAVCAAALATGANAASFQNGTGLAAPTSVETFDGAPLADGTAAGSLFGGLTFSSNLIVSSFFSGWVPNQSGQTLGNYQAATGDCPCATFSDINFGTAVQGAAFSLAMSPGTVDFSAYLGQTLVEHATFQTGYGGDYVGFSGITFDRIVFGSDANYPALILDNLQTTAAVPEPATTALMALGLLGMGVVMRRRASKQG